MHACYHDTYLYVIVLIIWQYFLTLCWLDNILYTVQSAGVMSVYLFMKRYTAEELYQPRHASFYRPRLSNCSDHSGQFLHPEAWSRGRSPSDISSEASLQMSASYPALLKCPDYDQVSSSPCWVVTEEVARQRPQDRTQFSFKRKHTHFWNFKYSFGEGHINGCDRGGRRNQDVFHW